MNGGSGERGAGSGDSTPATESREIPSTQDLPAPRSSLPAPVSWQSSRDRTRGRGLFWQTLGELSSVKTAVTLIACLTVVVWVAAYYERDFGMAAAHVMFYQAWWFNLIFIFMAVAVVGAVLVRLPLRRQQTGFAIVHCGLLLLIAGFWLGGAGRLDGMLNAWPGEPAHLIELPTDEIDIVASHTDPSDKTDISWRSAPFEPLAWSGHPSALRYLLHPLWPAQRPGLYVLPESRQLAALPDGTTISATRVVDTGAAELGWGPAPGNPVAQPATRIDLSLRPPMATSFQTFAGAWLTPIGEGLFSRGPLTVTMARATSAEMIADFLSTTPETATDGRLLIYFQGRKLTLEVDRQRLPQQLDIDPDLALTVVRIIPNPKHDNSGLIQDDQAPPNPVVELAVRSGHGATATIRTLFASAYSLLPPVTGLPNVLYRHPQLDDPVGGGQGAYVQLLVGPDERLHLRSFSRSSGAVASASIASGAWEGTVAGGATNAMQLKLAVRHLPQAVPMPEPLAMRPDRKDRATRWLEFEVAHGGTAVRTWLARGQRTAITVPGRGEINLSYRKALYDLQVKHGFSVVLDTFTAGKDPGGAGNATYASTITAIGADNVRTTHEITMNEPLQRNGVTLYQTAFFPATDDHGQPTGKDVSVFTVATDRGRILKYLGSLVLVAGILVMYLMRR